MMEGNSCSFDAVNIKNEPEYEFNEQVHVKVEIEFLKEEAEWGDSAGVEESPLSSLYAGHQVKDELVLGPEGLQPRDVAFTQTAHARGVHHEHTYARTQPPAEGTPPPAEETLENSDPSRGGYHRDHTYAKTESSNAEVHVKEEVVECLKEEVEWEALAVREQPVLRDCAVRLERIDSLEALLEGTRRVEHNADVGNRTHTTTNIATEKEAYVCDICKKRFDLKTQLVEHVMTHIHRRTEREESMRGVARNAPAGGGRGEGREPTRARGYRYSCEICKKKFPTPSKLKRHERIHTGERPFACEICQQKFTVLGNLKRHERTHTGAKPFSCGICKQKFAQSSNVKEHERTHTGDRPFACRICQQKFAQSSSLKTHEQKHTGEKPFSCAICKQKFARSSSLKRHERTHTGAKTFSCGICQQKFAQLSTLKKHARTHTGEKPFFCGICKRRFAHSSSLKRHERTHTREKPYTFSVSSREKP